MTTWFVAAVSLLLIDAHAAPPAHPDGGVGTGTPRFLEDPASAAKGAAEDRKASADEKRAERLAQLDAINAGKSARVVVLKWQGTSTDYSNEAVQRTVRTRIARPDAKFYPEIDLYQAGRKEPDRAVRPNDQRAVVPDDVVARSRREVAAIATVPWNRMPEHEWGLKAQELRELAQQFWFIDRPELREPLFQLYIQVGRAAENMNNPVAPFYEYIGGQNVNYYWYLAGTLAYREPELLSKVTDPDLHGSVKYYKDLLDQGGFTPMTLAFEMEDKWDVKGFASEYQVYLNGLEILVDNKDSLYQVPPGRVDVFLRRSDGYSIADSVEIHKLENKIYFVRDVARKRMGIDFIDQLMEHPNECTPELDGDILTYLSIYGTLHPTSDVYVAVPVAGNANRTLIWRFDRMTGTLQRVLDDTGGFPVRFVALAGIGTTFSGVEVTRPSDPANPGQVQSCATDPVGCGPSSRLVPSGIPLSLELRGHYGRLLVLTGIEGSYALVQGGYIDRYQTDGSPLQGDKLKERAWGRLVYGGLGGVLGKDAAIGFGPRGYLRTGWINVPHLVDLTGHLGYAMEAPFSSKSGRVRPLLDADLWAGAQLPFGDTVFPGPVPAFGVKLAAGLTF